MNFLSLTDKLFLRNFRERAVALAASKRLDRNELELQPSLSGNAIGPMCEVTRSLRRCLKDFDPCLLDGVRPGFRNPGAETRENLMVLEMRARTL